MLQMHSNEADKSVLACRFITILYYLNDVEQGGETAFPVADNFTVKWKVGVSYIALQFLKCPNKVKKIVSGLLFTRIFVILDHTGEISAQPVPGLTC